MTREEFVSCRLKNFFTKTGAAVGHLVVVPIEMDGDTESGIYVPFPTNLPTMFSRVVGISDATREVCVSDVVVHLPGAWDDFALVDGVKYYSLNECAVMAIVEGYDA